MQKLFRQRLRRNWAFAKLAIVSNLEYRLNYFVDALVQPSLACLIEVALWTSIFATILVATGKTEIGGFTKDYYIAYVIWSAFIARISSNWMYEFRMIEDINNGTMNTVITRPMSFFEYYFSQFMGYKIITLFVSISVPIAACLILDLPLNFARLPLALALVMYYLIFLYLLSFIVATVSFYLNRIYGLTMAKNLALWIISGELVPLDIFPEPSRSFLMSLPFANGVFTPTAYLTGRIDLQAILNGFTSVTFGIIICAIIASLAWQKGMKQYTGTGA